MSITESGMRYEITPYPDTSPGYDTTSPGLNTSGAEHDCPPNSQSPILFYAAFFPVFYMGIVGNVLLVLIFLRNKSMRSGPNTFIFNLSLTDLGTVLSCASAPLLENAGPSHPTLCRLLRALMEACMGASAFTLVALSAERYYAISWPIQARSRSTRSRTALWVIVVIWLMAGGFSLGKQILLTPLRCAKCLQMYDPNDFNNSYTVLDFIYFYMSPLIIIACFYMMMANELFFSGLSFRNRSDTNSTIKNHLQVRKRVAWTVLALVVMFALFYLPFNLMSLMLYFGDAATKDHPWTPLKSVLYCIGCLHNSFNPVVLYFLSKSFRGHFNNYLCAFRSSQVVEVEDTGCHCDECGQNNDSHKPPISPI